MKPANALRQLGTTQQKLLRKLLSSPQGATVEALCQAVGVTHNAVRQHLTALMAQGFVARGESVAVIDVAQDHRHVHVSGSAFEGADVEHTEGRGK